MKTKTYQERVTEDQRYLILEALSEDDDYCVPEHLLRVRLRDLGHGLSPEDLARELRWLETQDLITLLGGEIRVARLTTRGEDAVTGAYRVPGVARPRATE